MSLFTPKGLGGLVPGTTLTSLGPSNGLGSLLGNALRDVPPPPPPPHNALATSLWGEGPLSSLGNVFLQPQTKRNAYFAFRFEDIMRVNNVRKGWRINHPDSPTMRSFRDRSIWGKSKAQEPESLKALMRDEVVHSSAICVLVGTNTWKGRWVKYEIARAIADRRGLLAVHINGLNHHQRQTPDTLGYNPLKCMGVYHSPNGRYYIYETFVEVDPQTEQLGWAWRPYQDFKDAVELPRYISSIPQGIVMPLARYTSEHDYATQNGDANIGAWIDCAAVAVGR
jgi:MTH538 TIR-like domain (DUF1863)